MAQAINKYAARRNAAKATGLSSSALDASQELISQLNGSVSNAMCTNRSEIFTVVNGHTISLAELDRYTQIRKDDSLRGINQYNDPAICDKDKDILSAIGRDGKVYA